MAEEAKTIGGQPVQHQEAIPQNNHQSPRPCPQDCTKCPTQQQIFCSTKMLFDMSRSQQQLRNQMEEMSRTILTLQDQMKPKESDGQLSIPFIEQT